ncbi:hypothetical protein ANN_05928 [Periplaneta americana]|uniref:Endonuclease/exonuclease/phosphatase domain-containing protein n=1 Tax=Periplaneta americana TaxID=6978 RepID=A0ABQ8TDX8_PERAM|nr:hypothetical protein ANN_05928 [Periplaneta americana]
MSPGSSTETYPAFAHIGSRENPGKNLNQVTCPDRESNPGHLVSRPDALAVTPQFTVQRRSVILEKEISNDREGKRGGGVAGYIRSDLRPKIIHNSPSQYSAKPEFMFIEICTLFTKCLVCVVYKPPHIYDVDDFETGLLNVTPQYENVIIMGDFNSNLLDSHSSTTKRLQSFFQCLDMVILPLAPTHHTEGTDTVLDLIITNNADKILTHGQLPAPGLSGHDIIYLSFNLQCPKSAPRVITYRDIKRIDDIALKEDAAQLPWHMIWTLRTVDEKVDLFNTLILQLYDKHAPLKTKRTRRNPAPWMTTEIRSLMSERDLAYRKYTRKKNDEYFNSYKHLRNRTTQLIRNAKLKYSYKLIEPNTTPSELWKNLKVIGLEGLVNKQTFPSHLTA